MENTTGGQSGANITFNCFHNAFSENTTALDLTLPVGSPTVSAGTTISS